MVTLLGGITGFVCEVSTHITRCPLVLPWYGAANYWDTGITHQEGQVIGRTSAECFILYVQDCRMYAKTYFFNIKVDFTRK